MKTPAMEPPRRPTVILLHSSASSSRQWQDLVDMLRLAFRVLTVDFHGHGLRPEWNGDAPLTLANEAALAEPLLQASGGAHIVGHSYGAVVALKLASLHPGLVSSVVAYEPVLFRLLVDDRARRAPAQEVLAMAGAMRARLAQGQQEAAARLFIDFWSGTGAWQAMPASRQQAIALSISSVMEQFDALFHEPFPHHQLAHMAMPMLFLSGARSVPVARRISQLLRVALPLALHEELPLMGHMGPITHPAHVNHRVAQFLHAQLSFSSTYPLLRPSLQPSKEISR
ncbi:MAG: alpha/beta fold hydrolase [Ramlibacter sp.]